MEKEIVAVKVEEVENTCKKEMCVVGKGEGKESRWKVQKSFGETGKVRGKGKYVECKRSRNSGRERY